GDTAGLLVGGGVAEHGGQEGLAVEPVHGCGRVRGDGGGTRDVAQQGNLSYAVAAPAPAQEMAVLLDIELAGRDRVVGSSGLAWADKHGACRDLGWCQGGREALDRGRWQFGEQRKGTQQGDLHYRDRGFGVQGDQPAAADDGGQRQHGRYAEQGEAAAAQ